MFEMLDYTISQENRKNLINEAEKARMLKSSPSFIMKKNTKEKFFYSHVQNAFRHVKFFWTYAVSVIIHQDGAIPTTRKTRDLH